MRLGVGLALLVLAAGCSEARLEQARADMGCAPVDGLKQLSSNKPDYIVIGEFTETREAPAAFAELACNLAASGEPLFVGVSEYLGGATEAEKEMLVRLDEIRAKGASIAVGVVDDGNRPYDTRARTRSEKAWAQAIAAHVKASGATRALLLVSHTDARNAAWPRGERFAGYDPMPMHLDGEVLSLEIGGSPAPGLKAPTLRLYPEKTNGFSGQIALGSLTRPGIELDVATATGDVVADPRTTAILKRFKVDLADAAIQELLRRDVPRNEKIDALALILEGVLLDAAAGRGAPRSTDDSARVAEAYRREARSLATRLVDEQIKVVLPPPSQQLLLDDPSPAVPPPQTELPDFEANEGTP